MLYRLETHFCIPLLLRALATRENPGIQTAYVVLDRNRSLWMLSYLIYFYGTSELCTVDQKSRIDVTPRSC